eukprot:253414_1
MPPRDTFENMSDDRRSKLRRLSKGNVALVCVLEELQSEGNLGRNESRTLVSPNFPTEHIDSVSSQTKRHCRGLGANFTEHDFKAAVRLLPPRISRINKVGGSAEQRLIFADFFSVCFGSM